MSILQISKIQVRSGDLVDLPQLDEAEFGFANDSSRLFIGKTSPNENVEILTAYSSLAFSQITGANGANLSLSSFEEGQVLAISDNSGNVTVTNRGATKGGTINLGSVSNVKILGGSSTQVITTDGLGNLSFLDITSIVNVDPAGSNTQVQFNDNNNFGANTGFTFNKTTGLFSIPANISIAGNTLTTPSSNFSFANANATTIQFGGAATEIAIGATGSNVNFRGNVTLDKSLTFTDANGSNSDTSVYYINSGTEAIVVALNNSSRMQVENGQTVMFGNTVVHTGNLEFANVPAVLKIANANASNIQFGGAATEISIGATGSNVRFRGNIDLDKSITFLDSNGANLSDTSIYYMGGGDDAIVMALNNSSKIQINNGQTVMFGNSIVHTGNLEFANVPALLKIANANATTIHFAGAATAMAIGATGSAMTFRGNISLDKSLTFTDANGTVGDTSVYYIGGPPEALVVALNNSSKMQIENGQTLMYGNVLVESYLVRSTQVGISAAGATQGTATALARDINGVTNVSAGQGVILPPAIAGMGIVVINTNANNLLVYPATGATIDSNPTDSPYTLSGGSQKQFVALTTSSWYTLG